MEEIIGFLTTGAFVYFGLKVKVAFGDPWYYMLAAVMLAGGLLTERYT